MQSKAPTVEAYLAELPEDRRAAISAIREVILSNLDKDFEEGMNYGMIGYYVPHRIYPAGYHVNPKDPLPFAALASQKSHMSFYLMPLYTGDCSDYQDWFREQWTKGGRKLNMGKSCVRFKKLADVPLDVVGKAIKKVPAKKYIKQYEAARSAR